MVFSNMEKKKKNLENYLRQPNAQSDKSLPNKESGYRFNVMYPLDCSMQEKNALLCF